MPLGRITVIGDGGLLGEIMVTELARHGWITTLEEGETLISSFDPAPDMLVLWGEALDIGRRRECLRRIVPTKANPILVFLSQTDPHIYFTRLRGLHVDRKRLGFNELLEEIAGQLVTSPTRMVPVRAGFGKGRRVK